MKELDHTTLALARHLARHRLRWARQHRTKPVLFWVGGDAKRMAQWAQAHGVVGLAMAVVATDQPELAKWRLNPRAINTVVLLSRGGHPAVNLVNVKTEQALKHIETRFADFTLPRRAVCKGD